MKAVPRLMITFFSVSFVGSLIYFKIMPQFSGMLPVDGWEFHKSRNVSYYISGGPRMLPENFCTERKLLLVIVCSKPENFVARQAIRETWGQKNDNISFWFLYGEVGTNYNLQYWLDVESTIYNDTIQESFLDTYNNLTIKSVSMLKLFNNYCAENYRFLMKVDDDVFLNNIDLLIHELSRQKVNTKLLLGRKQEDISPVRYKGSKWYVPYAWYPDDKYPNFLCGPIYIMSAPVVKDIYDCTLQEPFLNTEDVFITGICAQKKNISLTNSDNFSCKKLSKSFCYYKHLYNIHYCTPDDIRTNFEKVNSDYCSAYSYSMIREWYTFFKSLIF